MWEAHGGGPVDGVLAVDVRGLRALLAATGPVQVGDDEVTEDSVEGLLLHDQYAGLAYGTDAQDEQADRRERLGDIARSVVADLQAGDLDLGALAGGLGQATGGRHLLAWAKDPAEQAGWKAAGVDGEVGPRSLLLSVLNRGGNKLDPFLDVSAEVTSKARADGGRDVSVRVHLANRAPAGEPPYVSGPRPDQPDIPEGTYVGLLALTMPGAASDPALADGALRQVVGRDGHSQVVATNVTLARGAERTVTVTFVLPKGADSVVVEPGARIPSTAWTVGSATWRDDQSRNVPFAP
jgi:hypothetical protein